MTSVALVVAEMAEEGHDAQTISSQFLNGAAVLLSRQCDEERFVALARRMWRSTVNQLALAELVDRATGAAGSSSNSSAARASTGGRPNQCPAQRTLRSVGGTAPRGKKS